MKYQDAALQLKDNQGQWDAYESQRNAIILAGPGSGKTKTLTIKVARLLDELIRYPQKIACLTYNNECVSELKERFFELEIVDDRNLAVSTVHAFCLEHILSKFARLLDASVPDPLKVVTTKEKDTFMDQSLNLVYPDRKPRGIRTKVDFVRRTCIDRQSVDWKSHYGAEAAIIEHYERMLRQNNSVDFDEIILTSLRLLKTSSRLRKIVGAQFPILVIDEYQDLGLPLHEIVLCLISSGVRIIAVGDPNQSIYGFAGAKPELINSLGDLPDTTVHELTINYRSGSKIIQCAQALLPERKNYKGHQSTPGSVHLYAVSEGLPAQAERIAASIIPNILHKAQARNFGEIAILYLDKNDGDVIAAACTNANIPFVRSDRGAPYQRGRLNPWLEDCARWCIGGWRRGFPKLSSLVYVYLSFMPTLQDEGRKRILKESLIAFLFAHRQEGLRLQEWLLQVRDACLKYLLEYEPQAREEAESFLAFYGQTIKGNPLGSLTLKDFAGMAGSPDYVKLITLHGAKGQEFDAVVMAGMESGRLPKIGADADPSADRNLFYVGLTRARNSVHITYSGWYTEWDKKKIAGRSPFIDQIAAFANHS